MLCICPCFLKKESITLPFILNLSKPRVFWLGLDQMSHLTKDGNWTLKVVIKYYQMKTRMAGNYTADPRAGSSGVGYWENFRVANETEHFKLTIGRRIKADNMGDRDPWNYKGTHNGSNFSTKDRNNDPSGFNCAVTSNSGWWYNECYYVNLNIDGRTLRQKTKMNWYGGFSEYVAASESSMWIKQAPLTKPNPSLSPAPNTS